VRRNIEQGLDASEALPSAVEIGRSICPAFTRCGSTRGKVHRGKPVHHWNLHVLDTDSGSGARVRGGKDDQHSGDDHVHCRTRELNEEFLPRLFRNALKLRDTAMTNPSYRTTPSGSIATNHGVPPVR
jgi:hypothetical protein